MKLLTRGLLMIASGLLVIGLAVFVGARFMDTAVTESDQNVVDWWAKLLFAAAAFAAVPPVLLSAVERDRAASRMSYDDA